jgi:hypothetical protein
MMIRFLDFVCLLGVFVHSLLPLEFLTHENEFRNDYDLMFSTKQILEDFPPTCNVRILSSTNLHVIFTAKSHRILVLVSIIV